MNQKKITQYTDLIRSEIAPAMGCTEPAAAALCAAAAAAQLEHRPQSLQLEVSDYIFKNAMNVGIPGTEYIGLNIAAALGAVCAKPEKELAVLSGLDEEQRAAAEQLSQNTAISIVDGHAKVYIRALALDENGDSGEAVICGTHTNFILIRHGDQTVLEKKEQTPSGSAAKENPEAAELLSIASIWECIHTVPIEQLYFLRDLVQLNSSIAEEGLSHAYGLQVGMRLRQNTGAGLIAEDISNYAVAVTAAAADARMSGCEKAVMSVAGSGNQGLTATLPIIAAAQKAGKSEEIMLRSLALSVLVTIHAKEYIGRLSVLCGCSIASAIGVTAGIIYMFGGALPAVEMGIRTMTADISGMVCDGAKPGCALKIATSVSAAMRAAALALSGTGATAHDGIVSEDVEDTLKNLGELGVEGMSDTNHTILGILLRNAQNSECL